MDDTTDNNDGNEPLNNNDNTNDEMNDANDNDTQHDASSSAAANNNNSQVGAPSTQNNTQDDAPSLSTNGTTNNNNNRVTFSTNESPSTQSTTQATTNSNNQMLRQQSTTNSNQNSIHPTLPFLITHWLSNYTASLPSTTLSSSATSANANGNREKEKALQTIKNQSIILANAFETLGEFGTSSNALKGVEGKAEEEGRVLEGSKVEGTRSTTYSDLKRKYSPLLQIGNYSTSGGGVGSISKVGGNQSERYVICIVCVYEYCFNVVGAGAFGGIVIVLFVGLNNKKR